MSQETWEERSIELNPAGVNRALKHVSVPAMQVYLPPEDLVTGVAVVILPGGAFVHLAIDKEGYDVATWLNTLGIAGIVVRYRTAPSRHDREKAIASGELDAQRAIQLTRSRAAEWGLDPSKIGVMGFSAGGTLVASVGTQWDLGDVNAVDPITRFSSRPDFLCLIYSGGSDQHRARVSAETPPAFLAQAADDPLGAERSIAFAQALLLAKVPAEMHIFASGGHGFGLGVRGGPVTAWPDLFSNWIELLFGA